MASLSTVTPGRTDERLPRGGLRRAETNLIPRDEPVVQASISRFPSLQHALRVRHAAGSAAPATVGASMRPICAPTGERNWDRGLPTVSIFETAERTVDGELAETVCSGTADGIGGMIVYLELHAVRAGRRRC